MLLMFSRKNTCKGYSRKAKIPSSRRLLEYREPLTCERRTCFCITLQLKKN